MRVLVVNAGSSSLKLRLLDDADQIIASSDLPADAAGFDASKLAEVLRDWDAPDVVGHRIVHGGSDFTAAVHVDGRVQKRLRELTDFAPLHQPTSLAGLDAVTAQLPHVPAVACFDTAFHATIGPAAATYAVPADWRLRYGIRRYGFHGLSHAYASRRAADLLGRSPQGLRVITCHLGSGASLCAVVDGRSIDTTMGFTPLEGLVMATRSGTVDPGLVLWLVEHEHLTPHEVATALEHHSGLLALAGTSDMRVVETRAHSGDPDARLALDVYLHRLVGGIGAMAAAAEGLDVLVFTGGVGERSATVRQLAAGRMAWAGIDVDPGRNAGASGDTDISAATAAVQTLVVAAREDIQIARESRHLLRLR
ncbi:MAG: acetate/propionate family kinase [Propionibacteriales bacterium]|nr:acetate/propionate family kinase [Propionibacteriales bacterium]